MSTTESLAQNSASVAVAAQAAQHRARPLVLHNSRFLCVLTMAIGVSAAFIGVCMMPIIFSLILPFSDISFTRVVAAAEWGLSGVCMFILCPALWGWGLAMLHKRVKLDERGADFTLGTRKKPIALFMPWETIASIKQRRTSSGQQFTVTASDGSYAQFASTTFFRAKHVAQRIAERAGLSIEKI